MQRLYFDTETTGFPPKTGAPLIECPHIVQLAALLVDDETGEVGSLNVIIRPEGWAISEDVAAIHGISTEKALACGIPVAVAMAAFCALAGNAAQVVAHNIPFDMALVCYEVERIGMRADFLNTDRFCTMRATTDICKLPGRFPGKFKWPKLIEAHRHFFGEDFDGQHDALADVRACARIHRHLLGLETKHVAADEMAELPM
jgi:DNA polymerase-3 subunit epsilon